MSKPCVWVAKPWPAVAAKIEYAERVQSLLHNLNHNEEESWQNALLSLLETYHVNISSLDITIPIDDYLDQAVGFQGAYSFPSCSPPRSIVYCTTSIIQHTKCSWLQEASSVYGIEPNLQCIRTEHLDRCMQDVKHKVSDVVLVDHDNRLRAQKEYDLQPILYEFSSILHERYAVVAVVKADSKIRNFGDLKYHKACFPSYEGAAFVSVAETLRNLTLTTSECSLSEGLMEFFSLDSCFWDETKSNKCNDQYRGDEGALRCLNDGADVAFINMEIWKNFTEKTIQDTLLKHEKPEKFKLLCPYGVDKKIHDFCYIHWTTRGHLMIHNSTLLMRKNEIYNSLRDMDRLFGKKMNTKTQTFTLYGPYDKKNNVLFR